MNQTLQQTVVDIIIGAPIETVWRALRDPAEIANWFGWEAPSLAEEIQFIFGDGATADDDAHRIGFGEWEGASDAIELGPVAAGTRLRLVRTGGASLDWSGRYDDVAEGWVTFFEQLRFALERHAGDERRTIYLSGACRPGTAQPSDALGLTNARTLSAGDDVDMALAPGGRAQGKIWFKTHFQTAVTVDAWGDGLLVVTDMGVSPKWPEGGGSVVITTYGLSYADFTALQDRWQAWWDERFQAIES